MNHVFEGRINGHKGIKRLKKAFLEEIKRHVDCNRRYADVIRLFTNKEECRFRFATTRHSF